MAWTNSEGDLSMRVPADPNLKYKMFVLDYETKKLIYSNDVYTHETFKAANNFNNFQENLKVVRQAARKVEETKK